MKKIFTAIVTAVLVLLLLPQISAEGEAEVTTVGYSSQRVVKADLTQVADILDFDSHLDDNAFKITNADGLVKLSALVSEWETFSGSTVYLANDIDMTGVTDFVPIGNDISEGAPLIYFGGVFDGQGHVIDNLVMNNTKTGIMAYTALFGAVRSATIKNLVIGKNSSFTYSGASNDARTAAIVARVHRYDTPTVIDNVYNMAAVNGLRFTGGIAAHIDGNANSVTYEIKNCTNTGDVKGNSGVGGMVGYVGGRKIDVTNCRNTGKITLIGEAPANHLAAGGIVGRPNSANGVNITGCINNGNIEGPGNLGGIVGIINNANTNIKDCINYGFCTASATDGLTGQIVGNDIYTGNDNILENCISNAGLSDPTVGTIETIVPVFPEVSKDTSTALPDTSEEPTSTTETPVSVTETPTEAPTEEPTGINTVPATKAPETTKPKTEKSCGSVSGAAIIVMLAGCASCVAIFIKKK